MKIKPCKICGNVPELKIAYDKQNDMNCYFLMCDNLLLCDSDIWTSYYDVMDKDSKEDCIRDWNKQN